MVLEVTSKPTASILNAFETFCCNSVMFNPVAVNCVEFGCAHTAGVCGNADDMWSEKSCIRFECPVITIAAAALVGNVVLVRLSIQPLVLLFGVGEDGVLAQLALCPGHGSSGQ